MAALLNAVIGTPRMYVDVGGLLQSTSVSWGKHLLIIGEKGWLVTQVVKEAGLMPVQVVDGGLVVGVRLHSQPPFCES